MRTLDKTPLPFVDMSATIYSLLVLGSQLLSIQKKVSLVFHFLFIFMLQIFQGQADPLISDFKLPHDGPALGFKC